MNRLMHASILAKYDSNGTIKMARQLKIVIVVKNLEDVVTVLDIFWLNLYLFMLCDIDVLTA